MLLAQILVMISILFEPFPVSSSGNAALVELLMARFFPGGSSFPIPSCIDYMLHGPIMIVVGIFFYRRWSFLLYQPYRFRYIIAQIFWLWVVADSITVFFYILFLHLGKSFCPLWLGFIITTLLLFSLKYASYQKNIRLRGAHALVLGIAQGCALLPGISRFGATFVVARWLGFSDKNSFEMSFLIEFPISFAASVLGTYNFIYKNQ